MINDEADKVLKKLFKSIENRCQNKLESMKGSEFFFHYVYLSYYKYNKINPNCGESYIYSPDWIKNNKTTTNPINKKDNKCFQYVIRVALNHGEIKKGSQKIKEIKPFKKKYRWEGINFPSEKDDWKKNEKSNATIAVIVKYAQKENI